MAPLQTDTSWSSGTRLLHRQRRSAAAVSRHHAAERHGGHRSSNLDANSPHHFSRPYSRARAQPPRNNQVWAPLYQPTSANQAEVKQAQRSGVQTTVQQKHQERPYDPLLSSFCTGEHVHYRICNSNVISLFPVWWNYFSVLRASRGRVLHMGLVELY